MKISALLGLACIAAIGATPCFGADLSAPERAELTGWRHCFADAGAQECAGARPLAYWRGYPQACGMAAPAVVIDDAVATEMKRDVTNGNFVSEINALFEGLQHLCGAKGQSYKPTITGLKAVHFVLVPASQLPNGNASLTYDAGKKELVVGESKAVQYNIEDYLMEWAPKHLR